MTQTIASAALEAAAQQQNRRVSARVVDDPGKPVLANEYLQKQVLALMPGLKRYARVLTRDAVAADDLLQDCLARALEKIHLWEPGTDLRAWLFTILHHRHISHTRRDARRRDYLKSQQPASSLALSPEQSARLELRDLERGLAKLPEEQRSAILLVGLEGMDYAQAAAVMNIPLGTVRSRIARGRESLRNVTGLFPARHARSNGTAHLVSQGRSRSGRKDFQPLRRESAPAPKSQEVVQ